MTPHPHKAPTPTPSDNWPSIGNRWYRHLSDFDEEELAQRGA